MVSLPIFTDREREKKSIIQFDHRTSGFFYFVPLTQSNFFSYDICELSKIKISHYIDLKKLTTAEIIKNDRLKGNSSYVLSHKGKIEVSCFIEHFRILRQNKNEQISRTDVII